MFYRPIKNTEQRLLVRAVTPDRAVGERLRRALEPTGRYHLEVLATPLADADTALLRAGMASLLIVKFEQGTDTELAALENLLRPWQTPPAVIVISDALAEAATRKLLKLQIADWLPRSCTDRELVLACEHALRPAGPGAVKQARCTTFIPALGGAGTSTLSIAAATVLSRASRSPLGGCCVVDLNFQAGSVADYLDLTPNLQLGEIAGTPERLDGHLLEVMLSRHASGLALLAAPPSLTGFDTMSGGIVGRLLDLASLKFDHLIIDLPRFWLPWCENVIRGTDAFFIVTTMTVSGLRQARRMAEMLETVCEADTRATIIVNKAPWLGSGAGVKKAHARELLGERLAGFVTDCGQLVRLAQDRGVLLSEVKKANRIEADLKQIFAGAPNKRSGNGERNP